MKRQAATSALLFGRTIARAAMFALFALCCGGRGMAASPTDPASVLILVNDATPPETGTGGKSASVFVGEYYAEKRGIPKSNIVHVTVPMANPTAWDAWNVTWTVYDTRIRQPLLKFLSDNGLTEKIHYIVSVYGLPIRIVKGKDRQNIPDGLSVDSFLATINSGVDTVLMANPYYAPVQEGEHFRNWKNPRGWKMYLVTRIDGPSVAIATGLVDKAMRAEENLKPSDGTAYFDWRHLTSNDGYAFADRTFLNAYNLAKQKGFKAVLNDNGSSRAKMIHDAPDTLWAWGWYSSTETWDGYRFVEGAVGAQLTSYTANSIRTSSLPGTWVPLWLKAGITATWGATAEPFTTGYAMGDNLLNHFWSGYNFAESAYLAAPYLNHMMIFVGDPLYTPKVFQPGKLALSDPAIVNAADGTPNLSPGSIATMWGTGLSYCTLSNWSRILASSLCVTQVAFNGTPAPLFYASPTQINLMVPRDLPADRDVQVTISREDGEGASFTLPAARLSAAAAAIFLYRPDGTARAVIQNSDYSTNGPSSLGFRPLKRGEAAVIYANGLGPVDAPVSDTQPLAANGTLVRTLMPVEVYVNGIAQHPFFAGLTPGFVGVYQVNFILDPATPVSGNDQDTVWLSVNGAESQRVHISLQL